VRRQPRRNRQIYACCTLQAARTETDYRFAYRARNATATISVQVYAAPYGRALVGRRVVCALIDSPRGTTRATTTAMTATIRWTVLLGRPVINRVRNSAPIVTQKLIAAGAAAAGCGGTATWQFCCRSMQKAEGG